jgi:site-specific DNA-methyltransferase (adenine-specific)
LAADGSDRVVPDEIRLVKPAPGSDIPEPESAFHPGDGLLTSEVGVEPSSAVVFSDLGRGIHLYHADCLAVMDMIAEKHPAGCFDLIFADPPYFLSNGGITCHAGKRVKVDKGAWDKSRGADENHRFNRSWLRRCQALLKPNGTIFVSGTHHVILSVGFAMQQLGLKVLNQITWQKPNPPPNLACRTFTHSTETLLWAAKDERSRHVFHYAEMKKANGGKQMKDVWKFTAPARSEKRLGRHPTQKPLQLLDRILLAASREGDLVLDPFLGSGTTAIACALRGRRCVGIEKDSAHVRLAEKRLRDSMQPKPVQAEFVIANVATA